jgi:hypothetical protein
MACEARDGQTMARKDDQPLGRSWFLVHSLTAGMPRVGRAVWRAPSSPALVVGSSQLERRPRARLTPSAAGRGLCGRGGKGQPARGLDEVGEPHEQGLLGPEDFPY